MLIDRAAAKERPERDLNPDLCDAGAVLHQLSYAANWELVIMHVNDKPADSGYMRFNNENNFKVNDLRRK